MAEYLFDEQRGPSAADLAEFAEWRSRQEAIDGTDDDGGESEIEPDAPTFATEAEYRAHWYASTYPTPFAAALAASPTD